MRSCSTKRPVLFCSSIIGTKGKHTGVFKIDITHISTNLSDFVCPPSRWGGMVLATSKNLDFFIMKEAGMLRWPPSTLTLFKMSSHFTWLNMARAAAPRLLPTILHATFSSHGNVLVRCSVIFFLTTGGVPGRQRGQTELGPWLHAGLTLSKASTKQVAWRGPLNAAPLHFQRKSFQTASTCVIFSGLGAILVTATAAYFVPIPAAM